jgi:ribosomal protein S12 methylthiotransferase
LIKGKKPVSRPIDAILDDARRLQTDGVREIILIAQDTTDYGYDLGLKDGLSILLDALVDAVPEIDWIRILYAFPGYVTDRLIKIMATYPQVVHYLDIPLQHADPKILKMMHRPANIDWVYRTLEKMRKAIPDLALRTTFIVGYPGETEQEFQKLLSFIEEIEFDKVGAFQFSFEKGTASEALGDPVPPEVKQERYDRLMTLQQGISLKNNQKFIGKSLKVLVEGKGEGITLGRSYRDAPEIDGYIIVEDEKFPVGEMVNVRITGAMPYDLSGIWEE